MTLNLFRRCSPAFLFSGLFMFLVPQSTALGGISETWDQMMMIPAPASVQLGSLESDTQVYVFEERANVRLSADVPVDVTASGTVPLGSINLSPGVISAGTYVNSYLVHFDVVGTPAQVIATTGLTNAIVFDSPVLGIQILSQSLDAADSILGATSTWYPIGESLRGLELAPGQIGFNTFDGIMLSNDHMTVSSRFSTQLSMDQIRIITAGVPEPASLIQLCIGAAVMVFWGPLRRRFRPQLN